jgi:hypothetical protein
MRLVILIKCCVELDSCVWAFKKVGVIKNLYGLLKKLPFGNTTLFVNSHIGF